MFLIDPSDIRNFERNESELQLFWLFCIIAAGKVARVQAKKLNEFLSPAAKNNFTPFEYLKNIPDITEPLKKHRLGQYDRISKAFTQSLDLDLSTCTIDDLEAIHGVGPKTSRFFMLYTRPEQKFAVIDTHVLKWFRDELGMKVPKMTPSGGQYAKLEKVFLNYCIKHGINPEVLDLRIWNSYSRS